MGKLTLHCGNERTSEAEVRAVPAPEFTKTWRPYSHAHVLNIIAKTCYDVGVGVTRREYSLNKSGTRMFGVWDLDYTQNGQCYSLGFRNSTDMSFAVGMCGGIRIFICDNLALSGTFTVFARHTSGLDDERMLSMAHQSLTGAWDDMKRLDMFNQKLRQIDLSEKQFKAVTFDLMKSGVVAPARFNAYLDAHDQERNPKCISMSFDESRKVYHYEKDTSLATVHGACTRLMRTNNLFSIAGKGAKLFAVCDEYLQQVDKAA